VRKGWLDAMSFVHLSTRCTTYIQRRDLHRAIMFSSVLPERTAPFGATILPDRACHLLLKVHAAFARAALSIVSRRELIPDIQPFRTGRLLHALPWTVRYFWCLIFRKILGLTPRSRIKDTVPYGTICSEKHSSSSRLWNRIRSLQDLPRSITPMYRPSQVR